MASDALSAFQSIARRGASGGSGIEPHPSQGVDHPFDMRNIHPAVSVWCKDLFDNGHYQEATFKAFKMIEVKIKQESGIRATGFKLMMAAFDEEKPLIKLTALSSESEIDEQRGFRHLFAGAAAAIRNPRAHEDIGDSLDDCLDHLSFASYLMRRLDGKLSLQSLGKAGRTP